ncbi:MAG: cobalamin-dependent protein [Deltaproteobacteria bacterium]|nr:cobalamin-dependent protein [Deltaproteobacteria bacterium]
MKTLLLHVPKLEDFYLPFGRYMNVNYMPMGLAGMAHYLNRSGHPSEILHAGVEKILDPGWRIAETVGDADIGAIGLSLHWHYQAYDVGQTVKRIKEARPDVFVFLGGITASYFGAEVLETYPDADGVVLGEGLEPARLLLDALDRNESPESVPNLAWRRGDEIIVNPRRMLHEDSFLDALPYADLSSLQNRDVYIRQFGFPLAYALELSPEENRRMMTMGRSFFPLFVGMGCQRVCSYCCGNARTQGKINAGHRVYWRDQDAVINDMKRARSYGYRTLALCFDPLPESTTYFVELFARMKRETPDMDLYFECWGLPEPAFIDAFAAAFDPPHSYLALSPDTGNDEIRRRNKGHIYTTTEFLACADRLKERGIQMDVFFSLGFPGETSETALETRDLMRQVAEACDNVRRLMVWAVQLEPGSPMFEAPEDWGIESERRHLIDFVRAHGERGDAYSVLGYKLPGFFGDDRDSGSVEDFERHFQQFKCMEFCFHSKDPRVYNHPHIGREECLKKRQMLARRRGESRPIEPISDTFTHACALAEDRPGDKRMEV